MSCSSAGLKPPLRANLTGSSQNFATSFVPLDVNVRRFFTLTRVEEEPVRANPQNRRHPDFLTRRWPSE
jgi:hypothetical protein